MKRINLYIIITILLTVFKVSASSVTNNISEEEKTKFTVEIKNSIGEPQTKVFLKITGRSDIYRADSCGIINFEYEVPKNYTRTANIYLNEDPKNPEKTFTLNKENNVLDFCIDTKEDILKFKQENSTFYIEGIVTTENGEPITGATVSIQGTGRYATTDEIGLFSIDADFNHYIIIRADGMENLSMTVSPFLMNQKDAYPIVMRPKSGDKIYSNVENMPEYPGGMKYFKRYIDKNLKYPELAKENKIEGVVVMQFVVEKNGDITSPRVVRKLEASLDSVAMNLIKGMPRWTPASDHGVKVRCKYSVPIAFRVPVPKPAVIDNSPIKDITSADSIRVLNDSTIIKPDTLSTDSVLNDSVLNDSVLNDSVLRKKILSDSITVVNDSIGNDSTLIKKQSEKDTSVESKTVKVKKRNIFVRFFRWLFGIKDKEEKNDKEATVEEKSNDISNIPVQQATKEEVEKEDSIKIEEEKEL